MMNSKFYFLVTLLLFLSASLVKAQERDQPKDIPFKKEYFPDQVDQMKEARKKYQKGEGMLYKGGKDAYLEALPYFKEAYEFNPNYSYLNYDYGMALLYSTRKYEAIKHFKKAHDLNPEVAEDIHLYLALGYQLSSEWDKAISYFQQVLKDDRMGDDQIRLAEKKIQECKNGKTLSDNPARVWIENLGETVNSQYPDYAPVVSANERRLFFTSRRKGGTGGKKDNYGEYFEDIYYSTRKFADWGEPKGMNDSINTDRHDATIGLSPDGRSLLVYNNEGSKGGNIMISQDKNSTWTKPKLLEGDVNTKKHEPSASLSFNEKQLFFVSDRKGGYGQHDIYVSEWDDEKEEWGEAVNLGPRVNSKYDERGVFIHPDNKTLYFSSNGHNNIGGLDVFKTVLQNGGWSSPVNLKPPINTPDDDVYYSVTGDGRHAYYSSYRSGGVGEKDIYQVTILGEEKTPLVADVFLSDDQSGGYDIDGVTSAESENNKYAYLLHGNIVRNTEKKNLRDLQIFVKKESGGEIIFKGRADTTTGSFYAGLQPDNKYIIEIKNQDGSIVMTDYLQTKNEKKYTVYEREFKMFKDEVTEGEELSFRDVFFDFDEAKLRKSGYSRLNQVVNYMNKNINVVMEVGGHTDARGTKAYNQRLSSRRAAVVKAYLIKKGIDKARLKSKGYGETEPFVSSAEIKKMDSEAAKDKAHQKNRRTAFKILSE